LDVRAIQQLSTQIIQRTAQNQIQQQTEKLQNRLGSEIEKAQQKLGGELEKVQSKLNDSVQGDLMKGINGLFGPKKQD
jgi:F0F1-type ATP synthase membrane subunit b/b'